VNVVKRASPRALLVGLPPSEAEGILHALAELGVPAVAVEAVDESEDPAVEIGALRVDPRGRTAHLDGRELELTAKEFGVLLFLARNSGAYVSRREFLVEVWNKPNGPPGRTVDIHISRIRAKFGPWGAAIETKVHVGYRLVPDRLGSAQAESATVT